jgi:hypothetical protein
VLENESCPKENREAAHKSAGVKRGELIVPKRPQKKEREQPVKQAALGKHRVESLGRGKKECDEHPDVGHIRKRRKIARDPLMKPN